MPSVGSSCYLIKIGGPRYRNSKNAYSVQQFWVLVNGTGPIKKC